jgi:hypothetical protein
MLHKAPQWVAFHGDSEYKHRNTTTAPEVLLGYDSNYDPDPGVQVRFPALPYFLRSSGSGTGSTQPREYNWGATWKSSGSGLENLDYGLGILHTDQVTPLYAQKLALTSLTSSGRLVGIVRSRTRAMEESWHFVGTYTYVPI